MEAWLCVQVSAATCASDMAAACRGQALFEGSAGALRHPCRESQIPGESYFLRGPITWPAHLRRHNGLIDKSRRHYTISLIRGIIGLTNFPQGIIESPCWHVWCEMYSYGILDK